MLSAFQSALYQRLQAFELDDPNHEFGFTRHLMKNNGWTLTYAQRAIAEYKKFAFLTVVANHQVVPSDQVDQVWHAHVLLTQSYWEEFCPKVLGKKLHHHPARGGRAEREEFHRLYAQTIASYRQFFGAPPIDLWSPPDVRFGAELKMQRISLNDHWVIPKRIPPLKIAQSWSILAIGVGLMLIYSGAAHGAMPEQATGNTAANLYWTILFGAVILGLSLRYVIQSPSQQPHKPQLDNYQTAYLAGGDSRAVELAITNLVHQGYLRPNVRNRTFAIEKQLAPEAPSLEQQVMKQVHRTPSFKDLRQASQYQTNFLRSSLEQEKLLMTGWAAFMGSSFVWFIPMTLLSGILLAVTCSGLGIQSLYVDGAICTAVWLSIGIVTLCCCSSSGRTRWGDRVLGQIQEQHNAYDLTQRFALYGYTALSGGALDDLKQVVAAEAQENTAGGCGCGC